MKLTARSNIKEVEQDIDALADQLKTAEYRAVNTLQAQGTVAGFRKIADIYGVGVRTIEKYASVQLASPTVPEATITVKGNGFPLIAFDARPTKRGVTAKIKGVRHLFPGTFIARMPNGHVGVFARGAYGGKGSRSIRETGRIGRFVLGRGQRVKVKNKWGSTERPSNELYTFSPPDTFDNEDVVDAMMDRIEEQAPLVIARELAAVRRGF